MKFQKKIYQLPKDKVLENTLLKPKENQKWISRAKYLEMLCILEDMTKKKWYYGIHTLELSEYDLNLLANITYVDLARVLVSKVNVIETQIKLYHQPHGIHNLIEIIDDIYMRHLVGDALSLFISVTPFL